MWVCGRGTMGPMSQDQKQNRVGALSGSEAKSPLDRAKQIQEMQRQMESLPVAPVKQQTPAVQAQAAVATSLQKLVETFDAKPVEAANLIKNEGNVKADAALYGSQQVNESALFGGPAKAGDVPEPTGPVWKTIPFGPPQTAALLDAKKPIESYNVNIPQQAVATKHGTLFQLTAQPKTGSDPAIKKAVLTDAKGNFKGAEFKSTGQLERALNEIPSFAMNLFSTVFGDGALKDQQKTHHKIVGVKQGKQSAYEVTLSRKNEINGVWGEKTVTVNNFGLKVQPNRDPRANDIVVAMYYLDRFQAA